MRYAVTLMAFVGVLSLAGCASVQGQAANQAVGRCSYEDHTKKDTEGEGIPNRDWNEGRDDSYTIRAICEIRPPNDVKLMTDLYQDARPLKRPARLKDATIVELVVYPFSSPHIIPQPYPLKSLPEALKKYTEPTLAMNYSPEMQREVKEIVKDATTDVEAVEKILTWIADNTRLDNTLPGFAPLRQINNQIVWDNPLGDEARNRRILERIFFADSMFKLRLHGTCTSLATLRGAMLRAAGLPTRYIQTVPLILRYEGDPEPLVDSMRNRSMARGYERELGEEGGINHMYNEVYLDHQWIRVDTIVGTGPFVGDTLFVKVYSAADFNNLYPVRPPEEAWNENRDFRVLEVLDAYPKGARAHEHMVNLAIEDKDLHVTQRPDGLFEAVIAIHNKGSVPSPYVPVKFCAEMPDGQLREIGMHRARPMPGAVWNEGSGPFALKEGEKRIVVIIDPDNVVKNVDKTNNRASKDVRP